jgi:acetyl-CoA synthetase
MVMAKIITEPNVQGQLVLKKASLLFRAYLHEDERYKKCFIGDWYLSGDLAKDADGYFFGLSVEPMKDKMPRGNASK